MTGRGALSTFIRGHQAEIIAEWQRIVCSMPSAREMDRAAMLDHIPPLLQRIAEMVDVLSRGEAPHLPTEEAARHAVERLGAGFDLSEVVYELAVLRDCILRLWGTDRRSENETASLRVLNEAIDRAISASVDHYAQARDRTLQALDRISTAAYTSSSLDEMLNSLLKVLLETMSSVDTAAILLREGGELRLRAAVGLEEDVARDLTLQMGEGFAGTIAYTGEPRSLRSAATDPLVKSESIRAAGIRALFGVPMVIGGEVNGVAHMGSRRAHDFSDQDKHLFKSLVYRATAIIEQFLLHEGLERRERQQAAVARLGQFALGERTLLEIMNMAAEEVTRTLDVELTKVLELQPDGRRLVLRAGVGWPEALIGSASVNVGHESQAGYALFSEGPVLVHDLRTETRFAAAPLLRDQGVISGVSVIIQGVSGQPYGILGAHSRQPRAFHPEDIDFVQAIANVIAAGFHRHYARARLRESEERFRLLVEGVRDYAIVTIDPEGRVTSWNPGAERIVGYRQEEVLGKALTMFYPTEENDRGDAAELLRRAAEDASVEHDGWRIRKDGTKFWANVTVTALRDETDHLDGYAIITRDMTERKVLMEKMARTNAELEAVIESIPDGVYIGDGDGVKRANSTGLSLLGFGSIDEMRQGFGRLAELTSPRDPETGRPLPRDEFGLVSAFRGEILVRELLLRNVRTGEDIIARSAAAPVRIDDRIVGAVAVTTDITERKIAEASQKFLVSLGQVTIESLEPEKILEHIATALVAGLSDGCLIDMLQPDGSLQLVASAHRDPAKLELLRSIRERFPPPPDASHGAQHVVSTGRPEVTFEVTDQLLAAAAQSPEHLEALRRLEVRAVVIEPLIARGHTLGAVTLLSSDAGQQFRWTATQVTEDVANRIALALDNARLFSEARQAMRLREDVLAIVSHDLRNPLSSIQLSVALLLKRTLECAEDAVTRRQLDLIQRSASRMARLITDLLDMANIQVRRLSVECRPVEAASLVEEAIELHEPIVLEKMLTLRRESRVAGVQVLCDRERILQVFSNLVGNAIKFCAAGGTVGVRAETLDGEVRFAVEDTGPGIASEERPHLFEPYWSAGQHQRLGTGLGLFISRGIVEAHGGRIWVESEPGRGSTFYFTLRRAR